MCKFNPKNGGRRMDPCMRTLIGNLQSLNIQTRACCCGHRRYPQTIIIHAHGWHYDLVSGKSVPRKKRFYRKDKDGQYYVPEVSTPVE